MMTAEEIKKNEKFERNKTTTRIKLNPNSPFNQAVLPAR